jgi:D-inositol-3-phosphate glycosyltransferase
MPDLRVVSDRLRRVAMISLHTSPLAPAGTGDAGGMNVAIDAVARELAARAIDVDVFTRATADSGSVTVEATPGYRVHHLAGAGTDLTKDDLAGHLCAFSAEVVGHEAARQHGGYDLVHSHYWLSGQVGWVAANAWGVPLVHSMHTLARVKNAARARSDRDEPAARIRGEDEIVAAADLLIANTGAEAADLQRLYGALPGQIQVVHPGVDLQAFAPGDRRAARRALGLPSDRTVLLFVGRLQPLKAPDLAIRALAAMVAQDSGLAQEVSLVICGGPSGSLPLQPEGLVALADRLGVGALVRIVPPVSRAGLAQLYRAADLTVVPSYNESFGLVAVESQAVGTPVVAAAVGGLRTAVADCGGVLVPGHEPEVWGSVLADLVRAPARRRRMSVAARRHAAQFSWSRTAEDMIKGYAQVLGGAQRRAAAG